MSKRSRLAALIHMRDHAIEAVNLVKKRTREELYNDRLLNLALVRLLEIIGEAAGRVPKELCVNHQEIPWSQIISMRNRLIHGYDSVDFDILWQIVSNDLPSLIPLLEVIISVEESD